MSIMRDCLLGNSIDITLLVVLSIMIRLEKNMIFQYPKDQLKHPMPNIWNAIVIKLYSIVGVQQQS